MHAALLVAALQAAAVPGGGEAVQDTARPMPDSADFATAFADPETRELVRLARGRRGVIHGSVFHYAATSRQRVSVGVRAFRRDRLLYRRETAARVSWYRDRPSRIRVEGAREAVPVAMEGVHVPDDVGDGARELMPRPGDDRLFVAPTDDGFAWHPLVEGGEALYRYAIGDTTVIRLPDGTEVRLVELRVTPRERDIRVITGSFWIELENHAIVQALFRPAREFDLERDLPRVDPDGDDDIDEIPGVLKPVVFEVDYVTVDYALWEMRWWMPRLLGFHGSLQLGPATFPVSVEVRYSDYTVEADRYGLPELPPLVLGLVGDPYNEPRPFTYPVTVEAADTTELLNSPLLLDSFYASGEGLITEGELADLADRLGVLPPAPWEVGRPRVTAPWALRHGLLRYNRVEGLSVGARVDWDLGRLRLDLTGRVGTADHRPGGELGVTVPRVRRSWRLAAYHGAAVADPSIRALGFGNSVTALLFGRDDGTYYRASGAELRGSPRDGDLYTVRVFAERQRSAAKNTDLSLPRAFDETHRFRPNIDAAPADQIGLDVQVGGEHGLDPTSLRWGAWLDVKAETGTFTFIRPGVTLRAAGPLAGLMGALEVAGGTTLGPAPIQAAWFLGGPGTLRGFSGGALSGTDYGRARAELANRFPAARLAVFADAGWAGAAGSFDTSALAYSVGIGASVLDGLLRVDVARRLEPDPGTRVELYLDAIF